jgi:hypothetical protein
MNKDLLGSANLGEKKSLARKTEIFFFLEMVGYEKTF